MTKKEKPCSCRKNVKCFNCFERELEERMEIKDIKRVIKILERGFGKGCKSYSDDCIQCRVNKARLILKEDVLECYK